MSILRSSDVAAKRNRNYFWKKHATEMHMQGGKNTVEKRCRFFLIKGSHQSHICMLEKLESLKGLQKGIFREWLKNSHQSLESIQLFFVDEHEFWPREYKRTKKKYCFFLTEYHQKIVCTGCLCSMGCHYTGETEEDTILLLQTTSNWVAIV